MQSLLSKFSWRAKGDFWMSNKLFRWKTKDPNCAFLRSICCCKWQIHAFAFSTAVDLLILIDVFTFYCTTAVFQNVNCNFSVSLNSWSLAPLQMSFSIDMNSSKSHSWKVTQLGFELGCGWLHSWSSFCFDTVLFHYD